MILLLDALVKPTDLFGDTVETFTERFVIVCIRTRFLLAITELWKIQHMELTNGITKHGATSPSTMLTCKGILGA